MENYLYNDLAMTSCNCHVHFPDLSDTKIMTRGHKIQHGMLGCTCEQGRQLLGHLKCHTSFAEHEICCLS